MFCVLILLVVLRGLIWAE